MKYFTLFLIFSLSFSLFSGELEDKLREAVIHRNIPKIRELLQEGANIDNKGKDGLTPIMLAIKMGYSEIAVFLIENGPFYPDGKGIANNELREKIFCWANCRNIEAAISLFNYIATEDERISLEYDYKNYDYIERELDKDTLNKIRKYLPGRKLPLYPKNCVYFLYAEDPIDKLSDSPPKIGVYCKIHGLPKLGYEAKKAKPYHKSDIWF